VLSGVFTAEDDVVDAAEIGETGAAGIGD